MEQMINNLANAFKDKELIECYKTKKEIIGEQKRIIEAKDKLIDIKDKEIQVWMEHFSNLNVDNQEQKNEIQSLKYRLKERNDYIHNLKWEHHKQLEQNEQNKDVMEQNEKLKKEIDRLKETITELKEEINKLKTQLGDPFVPY